MSGWRIDDDRGEVYYDSGTLTEVHITPIALAVRGVVQVTMRIDGEDLAAAVVRMGPDSADRLAKLLRDAAKRARRMP